MIIEPFPLPPPISTLIGQTIQRLHRLQAQPDPIVPPYLQRSYSILNSAVRMDGHILEAALFEALNSAPHLKVTRAPRINLPAAADQILAGHANAEALAGSDLYYDPRGGRRVTPDLSVWDRVRQALDWIEVKRGLGKTDCGKTRQTTRDLQCLLLIAKSYAKSQLGIDISTSTAAVCAIHGVTTVPLELQANVDELEVRYQIDIRSYLDAAQHEFRSRLEELLFNEALDHDLPNLIQLIEPASNPVC